VLLFERLTSGAHGLRAFLHLFYGAAQSSAKTMKGLPFSMT
jgi:hypothetical protein